MAGFRREGAGAARRGGLRDVALSLFGSVLLLSADRPVFTTYLYVIDGGSGKTRAVTDWNDTAHWLDQSNTTLQCALPMGHADFNGQPCLNFTGTQWYASNRGTVGWDWLADGSGVGIYAHVRSTSPALATQVLFATISAANQQGTTVYGSSNTVRLDLYKSTGAVLNAINAGALLASPQFLQLRHASAATPDYAFEVTGDTAKTGNYASAPGSGPVAQIPRLGSNLAATVPWVGRWATLVFTPYLPDDTVLRQWSQQTYGVAA